MFDQNRKYRNRELKKGRCGVFLTNVELLRNDVKDFLKKFYISPLIETKTKEKHEN